VRALLGHARLDTTQVYTTIRPPQLKRAVAFHEEQTSMPGVFAAGDVRLNSVKRVTSAVGEGAIAIQSVHDYLGQA
jgi:thioredoxin reductase